MSTLNISMPKQMKDYIETQVTLGLFGSDSEYIRTLIRKDKLQKERLQFETKILEGFQGKSRSLNSKDWDMIRKKARKRL